MHSVFDENFNLSQVKYSSTQIQTLKYYIAENIACLNTFVGSVRYLSTLLRYTLPHYSVELYPALIHYCGLLYQSRLLDYTQYQHIAEVNPILIHCLVSSNFIALMSYTES